MQPEPWLLRLPNSPAARGGIESGDVITSVNGEVVTDSRDLARKAAATAPGAATNVVVFRNGQEKKRSS